MSVFISTADESSEEKDARDVTKEEHELGMVKLWMEMGGLLVLAEEEAKELLCEVYPFLPGMVQSFNPFCHCSLFSEPDLCDGSHFFRVWIY